MELKKNFDRNYAMEPKENLPLQDFLAPLFVVFVQQYFPAIEMDLNS